MALSYGNPGAALTTNNRLTRLLQSQPDPNNGTMYGGLAHVLRQGMLGYLTGSDAREQQAAEKALASGMQTHAPVDGVGPTSPGGYQGAVNALSAMPDNPYAGRLTADLLQRQTALDQRQKELQAKRDFQTGLLDTKLGAQSQQNAANHQFTAQQNQLNRDNQLHLKAAPSYQAPTDNMQEYQQARAQGYPGSLLDFETAKKKAGATHISTNVNTAGNSFNKELGKKNADDFLAQRKAAQDAVSSLKNTQSARQFLDNGVITGFGANFELAAGKALQKAGIHLADDPIANTEAYAALRAQEVGRVIKQFGSGTGLSDADRQYAQKMAAGEITMNEASMRHILDISDRANRNIITRYNKQAQAIDPGLSPYPLTVDLPQDLQPQQAPQQLNGPIVSQAPPETAPGQQQAHPPQSGGIKFLGFE